jgi:hypothetical protein
MPDPTVNEIRHQTVNEIHDQTCCCAHENQKQAVTATEDELPTFFLPVTLLA